MMGYSTWGLSGRTGLATARRCRQFAVLVAGALLLVAASAGPLGAAGNSDLNQPSYYENLGYGTCTKTDSPSTPYTLGAAPSGRYWSLLVLKAGSAQSNDDWNTLVPNPAPGQYDHPSGKDISHVITCSKAGGGPATTTTTSTTLPGPTCDDYTPTMVTISPMTVLAGGAIVISGIAVPGDTVTATLSGGTLSSYPLGSDVADAVGQFSISATVPVGTSPGTYTVTVSSTQCPTSTTATIVVTGTVFSGCGMNEPARSLVRGSSVTWQLHVPSFSTSALVTLRLKRSGSNYLLYSGPWPPGNQVAVTIPATAPTGQYTLEQTGTKSNGKGSMTKTCPVWVVMPTTLVGAAPVPERNAGPLSGGQGLVAVALVALGSYGVARAARRRARLTG